MRATIFSSILAAALGFGWAVRGGPGPSVAPAPAPPVAPTVATRVEPLPRTVAAIPARTSPRVTADIPLSEGDRAVLEQDPKVEAAREMDETREMRRAQCKGAVHDPSEAYCERILAANGHAIERSIAIKQRFLRGEIDQDTFQSEFHKVFIERSIELEAFMPARDYLAHEHFPPGDDLYVAMSSGPVKAKTAHLGGEILDPESTQPMVEDPSVASSEVTP